MVKIDSDRIRFIPKEERWEPPYEDNVHRPERDEFYVLTIERSCEKPNNHHPNCGCEGRGMDRDREYSSIQITRNFETQTFILYVGGESMVEAQWADTPSGRGPNGHKRVLKQVEMFAKGWMAAEEEVPVWDVQIHPYGKDVTK